MTVRDAHEETVKSLRAEAAHHTDEVASLQSITSDLSRQVQNLTRQLAIRDDPSLANIPLDDPNGAEATDDIITERFTEFKSLRNLQEQNVKLLKLTRGLMAKLEQREVRRATAEDEEVDTVQSLEEAAETIEKLHAQLLEAQKKINEATRERDMFSKLLARGEGLKWTSGAVRLEDDVVPGASGSSGQVQAQAVQANQEVIDALRAEIAGIRTKAEEEVKGVRDELKEKLKAVGEAEIGRAKAEARAGMLQGQSRLMRI
jgi:nucleoprotein TPR